MYMSSKIKKSGENEYGWLYLTNGTVDFNYTGTASNEYGTFIVVNGEAFMQ